jgi:hypothetical protein
MVAVVSAQVDAQKLPFRASGDFYVADHGTSNESIFRFRDQNNDGDFQDAGEQTLFFGPSAVYKNMQGLTIHPGDGSVWVCCSTADAVLRLQDLNGDGDANDAGESTVYYDNTGSVPITGPTAITFDDHGVLYLVNSGSSDMVVRLMDGNNNGHANDPGEATIFLQNTTSNTWLSSPGDIIYVFDAVANKDVFYLIDNGTDQILQLFDANNDGDVLDAGEVRKWATAKPNGKFIWNIVFEPADQAIYGLDTNSGGSHIFRWQDLNKNGVATDPGEVKKYYDAAIGTTSLYLSFCLTSDASGSLYACPHTQDLIYKFTDMNADQDVHDAGEVTVIFDTAGSPNPAYPLDRARACTIGPAAVIAFGQQRPVIGKTADFLIDDQIAGSLAYVAAISYGNSGIPLPGADIRRIPIDPDPLSYLALTNQLPFLQDFMGQFMAPGQAVLKMQVPNLAGLVNLQLHMAFVSLKPGAPSNILSVSKPFSFVIGK